VIPEIEALVYDRIHPDVVYADNLIARAKREGFESLLTDEQASYIAGLKGRYTITDLNRVETAVQVLSELLKLYGYSAPVDTRAWTFPDIPVPPEMERYLRNIRTLIRAFFILPETPDLPEDMERLTFGEANDIERILYDISHLIDNMIHTIDVGWAMGIAHIGLYGGT